MRIGIPREVKTLEGRVALVPEAAGELVQAGHQVLVERDAGRLSGYPDAAYEAVGVEIAADAASLYAGAEMVVKVKEPQPEEVGYLREDHLLFCYLHLAA
ncbi:MAG TPA: alanine dehydrogenase, partial [Gammaproteobacteria bacterium]|nr:alanine dehydrogenase [Gammaproteobacteria bacterium]